MKNSKFNYFKTSVLFAVAVLASVLITACGKKDLALSGLKLGFNKTDIEYIDVKLNEVFSPSLLNYTVSVEKSYTATMLVTPELPAESTSTIKVNGADAKSGEKSKVELKPGENVIDITVTSASGASQSYKLNIKQEDWTKVYTSKLLSPGVWELSDLGGFVSNENMFLIEGQDKAILFDTGLGKGDLAAFVKTLTKLPIEVAITHGNGDHFAQVDQFKESTVYISKKDITRLPVNLRTPKFKYVQEGDVIDIGAGRKFEIFEIPGHTMGCLVFLDRANKIAITGDGISSGSMVYMFGTACCALDQYRDGLIRAEAKLKDLDSLTLLVGHVYQEKTPLHGNAGKQIFTDMRIAADKALSGEEIGKSVFTVRGENKTELKQTYYGLAGLWYNPNNKITHPASLGNLYVQMTDGTVINTRPVFSSVITAYTVALEPTVTSIELLPTVYNTAYKSMTINGKPAKTDVAFVVKLPKPENKFDILVTAADGSTKTYTITVTKQVKK